MAQDLAPTTTATYAERLWPTPAVGVVVLLLGGMATISFVPVSPLLGGVVGVLVVAGAVIAGLVTAPRVQVRDGELRAGAAHIPVSLLGSARTLDRAQARAELGPLLDARAYVCLRSWVGTAVRVEVSDPQDPTPYWLVSTRHPEQLVAALQAATPGS